MGSIVVSDLDYAPPEADTLFFEVNFGVGPGEHAAILGPNGADNSTNPGHPHSSAATQSLTRVRP